MSGFTKNGIDLNDLLMQSTNNNSGSSGFTMPPNGQDLYVRYGKWDGLARNQAAATGYTVNGADINTKFNRKNPTFQATLSGTFEYTGEVIQPTITASPDSSTGYNITYKGNKVDAASYLAVQRDFEPPAGYGWDTNYPQGSFTITQKPITLTLSGTGSFQYDGNSRSMSVIYGGRTFTSYTIVSGSLGPITNVSQSPISVTVRANGNYDSDQVSGSITITPKAITITINGTGTFAYTGETFTMNYSLNDSVPESSISTNSNTSITNGGTITYNVSLSGNYSGSASGTINIVQAFIDTQPIGGSGTSVSLSVTASGTPSGGSPSYQWQLNGGNISGATSSTLTANSSTGGSGSYKCVFTYTFNGVSHSVTSNAVDVTISTGSRNNRIVYVQNVDNGYMQIGINSPVAGDYRIILLESKNSTVIQDLGKITIINNDINKDICYKTYTTVSYSSSYSFAEPYQLRVVQLCPNYIGGEEGPEPVSNLKSPNFEHIDSYPNEPVVNFPCIEGYNIIPYDCPISSLPFLTLEETYNSADPSSVTLESRTRSLVTATGPAITAYLYIDNTIHTNISSDFQRSSTGVTGTWEITSQPSITEGNFTRYTIDNSALFNENGRYTIYINNQYTLTWDIQSPAPNTVSPNTVSPNTVDTNTVNTDTVSPPDIGCLKYGTPLLMADNTWKNIEDLLIGDEVVSATIPTLPINEYPSYFDWWSTTTLDGMSRVTTTVANTAHKTASFYYKINDIIEVTDTHIVLAKKSDNIWKFYKINELDIGDSIIDDNDQETPIVTKERIDETIHIVKLDVTTYDLFYTKGLLSHNLVEAK